MSSPNGQRVLISIGSEERSLPYVEALRAVGVAADAITVLTPGEGGRRDDLRALAAQATGLVLAGGADVDPARYGEIALTGARVEPVPERDAMEWELLAGAQEGQVPVWGVCRGLQVINVFLGGSLWQDIPTQLPAGEEIHEVADPLDALAHPARVLDERTGLGQRLAQGTLLVNSRHHQAIKALGRGLTAVATAPDGLIEACELDAAESGGWWLRAVQWHPENLLALAPQRSLWEDFAAISRPAAAGSAVHS